MPCCLALLALAAPRVTIVLLVVFSDYIGTAYESVWVPFIGFLFMPLTVLAYALAHHQNGAIEGWWLALVILAALFDFGLLGGGAKSARGDGD